MKPRGRRIGTALIIVLGAAAAILAARGLKGRSASPSPGSPDTAERDPAGFRGSPVASAPIPTKDLTAAQKEELVGRIEKHCLYVEAYPLGSKVGGQGSAVVFWCGGEWDVALTNRHVVFDKEHGVARGNVMVRWDQGRLAQGNFSEGVTLPAWPITVDPLPGHDVAFLAFKCPQGRQPLDLSKYGVDAEGKIYKKNWGTAADLMPYSEVLQPGRRVVAIGYPRQAPQRVATWGVVTQVGQDGAERWISHTARIAPGSSGGGLFDEHGHLMGINTRSFAGDLQALDIGRLLSRFGFTQMWMSPDPTTYRDTGTWLEAADEVWILAFGRWRFSKHYGGVDAGGRDGWPDYRVAPHAPFACLLAGTDGANWLPVSGRKLYGVPLPADVTALQVRVRNPGTLKLRINDTDAGAEHGGTLELFILHKKGERAVSPAATSPDVPLPPTWRECFTAALAEATKAGSGWSDADREAHYLRAEKLYNRGFEILRDTPPTNASERWAVSNAYYGRACIYAHRAGKAEPPGLKEHWAKAGLDALESAVAWGAFEFACGCHGSNRTHMKYDGDLVPLRDHPRFKQILPDRFVDVVTWSFGYGGFLGTDYTMYATLIVTNYAPRAVKATLRVEVLDESGNVQFGDSDTVDVPASTAKEVKWHNAEAEHSKRDRYKRIRAYIQSLHEE